MKQGELFTAKRRPKRRGRALPLEAKVVLEKLLSVNGWNRKKRKLFKALCSGESSSCFCCVRHTKVYHRPVYATMAKDLVRLSNKGGNDHFVHISEIGLKSGGRDFAKLARWGLIEGAPNEDKKKRTSGLWKLTDAGRKWVSGLSTIGSHHWEYDSVCLAVDGAQQVRISDVLGVEFDLREI